jgi:hypothetical protein
MRVRFAPCLALACLAALPAAARPDDAKDNLTPAVIVRVRSLDGILSDTKFLAAQAGKEEEARQFEGMIKERLGEKGLDGFDTKRPLGIYAIASPNGVDSPVVAMIPIKDEKAAIGMLENLGAKAEKGEGGLYTVKHEKLDVPIYFRFAHEYAYVTFKSETSIAKDKLLPPNEVLKAADTGLISAVIRLDQIPDNLKDIAALQAGARLADVREQHGLEGQTDAQKKLSEEATKEVGQHIKSLLKDGEALTLKLDVDHKAGEVTFEFSVAGKPGSKLAGNIAELGQTKSIFAGLAGKNSALSGLTSFVLPARVRKNLGPAIDEAIQKASERAGDEKHKEMVQKLLKAVEPSLKAGEIDAAVDLRGPSDKKHYTLVAGIKLKNGEEVEKTVKDLIQGLPQEQRDHIKVDAHSVGDVHIHEADIGHVLDDNARDMFGNGPAYFAVRSNAVFLALGDNALPALKGALSGAPGAAHMVQVELSVARLAKLMAHDQPAAPKAAEEAFGKNREGDKIRFTLEGGKSLKAQFSVQPLVIKFFDLLEKAKKGGTN